MIEFIKDITHTIDELPVKDLRWLPIDNIIVGAVKDPIFGKPELHDGWVIVQWSRYGKPLKQNKGRTELIIKLNY